MAKWREVPSLISGNTAVSEAVEQERQRQDGCAGLEAASISLSLAAGSCSAGITPSEKTFAAFCSFLFLLLKNFFFLFFFRAPKIHMLVFITSLLC